MGVEPAQVTLYYDCLSPFSYFAFTTLHRYASLQLWPMQLELKPMLLGGVMAATGNRPPGAREWAGATAAVGAQDMARNREWFHLPAMLGGPTNFFGPDGPADKRGLARDMRYQRLLTAIRIRCPDRPEVLREATRLTFELIWASAADRNAEGAVVITEEVLERIATEAGLAAQEAMDLVAKGITADDTKELLKATTSEAVAAGAYGAPFLVISQAGKDTMVAFGSDRFEQLAFSLGWEWLGPDPTRPTAGPRPRL